MFDAEAALKGDISTVEPGYPAHIFDAVCRAGSTWQAT